LDSDEVNFLEDGVEISVHKWTNNIINRTILYDTKILVYMFLNIDKVISLEVG
jgi:hypothetical protein